MVGHHHQRAEFHAEFVLGGRHFVVMLLDLDAHLGHGAEHFGAHVLSGVLWRHREISLLGADAVTQIAALIFGIHVRGQLDRVDPEAGVVGIGLELHVVEHEEFGFGPEIDVVADARRFHVGDGLLGHPARVAVIGLAGGRLEHVAHDRERGFREERIDARGRRVGHQVHIGLVDRLPAGDRRAVEHHAFSESVFFEHRDVEGDMLPLAARVGETAVDVLNVFVLHQFEDILSGRHLNLPPVILVPRARGTLRLNKCIR